MFRILKESFFVRGSDFFRGFLIPKGEQWIWIARTFFGALFFRLTAQHMYENILYGRHFQRPASFGICKIPPLFSEVRFSVIKGSSFRNLYGVKFVVRQ